jgi:hypothetical protein
MKLDISGMALLQSFFRLPIPNGSCGGARVRIEYAAGG